MKSNFASCIQPSSIVSSIVYNLKHSNYGYPREGWLGAPRFTAELLNRRRAQIKAIEGKYLQRNLEGAEPRL